MTPGPSERPETARVESTSRTVSRAGTSSNEVIAAPKAIRATSGNEQVRAAECLASRAPERSQRTARTNAVAAMKVTTRRGSSVATTAMPRARYRHDDGDARQRESERAARRGPGRGEAAVGRAQAGC